MYRIIDTINVFFTYHNIDISDIEMPELIVGYHNTKQLQLLL